MKEITPTQSAASEKQITYTAYIALTSQQYWGRGSTIEEAIAKANALSSKTGRIKRGVRVKVWRNDQTDDSLYNEAKRESAARSGVDLIGYEDGDRIPPFVGDYGNVIAYGELHKIHVPDHIA